MILSEKLKVIKPARARALANFTPIHHREGGRLRFGPDMYLFGEMPFTPFLHDVGAKYLIGRLRAKPEYMGPTEWLKWEMGPRTANFKKSLSMA